jgi:hypothetical protein
LFEGLLGLGDQLLQFLYRFTVRVIHRVVRRRVNWAGLRPPPPPHHPPER